MQQFEQPKQIPIWLYKVCDCYVFFANFYADLNHSLTNESGIITLKDDENATSRAVFSPEWYYYEPC